MQKVTTIAKKISPELTMLEKIGKEKKLQLLKKWKQKLLEKRRRKYFKMKRNSNLT